MTERVISFAKEGKQITLVLSLLIIKAHMYVCMSVYTPMTKWMNPSDTPGRNLAVYNVMYTEAFCVTMRVLYAHAFAALIQKLIYF